MWLPSPPPPLNISRVLQFAVGRARTQMATPKYEWARRWMAAFGGGETTHCMLDGGKLCVPGSDDERFVNAYANEVVRALSESAPLPCISEVRTPVFRLFADLDCKLAEASSRPAREDLLRAFGVINSRIGTLFEGPDEPRMIVCEKHPPLPDDALKLGYHLIWPDLSADAALALHMRAEVLEDVEREFPDMWANPWADVIDKNVFVGSGLRLPWSAKGRGDDRFYVPRWEMLGAREPTATEIGGVARTRQWVGELCIRRPSHARPSALRDGLVIEATGPTEIGAGGGVHVSLEPYESQLQLVRDSLPPELKGARLTNLVEYENAFTIGTDSHYCLNVKRDHKSNVRSDRLGWAPPTPTWPPSTRPPRRRSTCTWC